MATNTRPSYYSVPYRVPAGLGNPRAIPGKFSIHEYRDGLTCHAFDIANNTPDLFNAILKRGIPVDDARTIFYEITA